MAVGFTIFSFLFVSEAAISRAIAVILLFFSPVAWRVCVFLLLFSTDAGFVRIGLHLFPAVSR